jgi:hypothetical protein
MMKKNYRPSVIQKPNSLTLFFLILMSVSSAWSSVASQNTEKFLIDQNSPSYITDSYWESTPAGGDTIFISSCRTNAIKFYNIHGDDNNPVLVINKGGVVRINDTDSWGAIDFNQCSYIKISGQGHSDFKYGFELKANSCGLAFSGLSSDCEAEFIHVNHDGFFGIMAKKDYGGNPPSPAPVFSNLVIHDCFVENVTEGMYLGETKSPGMEFKHVRIYNNIVKNTGREAIQIANMTEDVEIFNNTLLNAGNDGESFHGNLLQIGDNSVARVTNNIMIGAPSYGIISFGMGNNNYSGNFISQCKGIFIDNRKFSTPGAPILISENYFRNTTEEKVIKNMNEINPFEISNNTWNTDILFYENASGNDSNFVLTNNQNQPVDSLWFTNPAENDYSLADEVSSVYQNMGAPGGPCNFTSEGNDENEEEYTAEPCQIVLTSNMVIDEVAGGSYHSPHYLVDEQDCTPENNQHPVSESWKPHWNMDNGPYHVIIDLQAVYHLTNISLHDMHNAKNLEVSVGEPGNWELLFTETCDKYKTWKKHTFDVSTRYIRLSMTESVYAAVNEIVVFGYLANEEVQKKSAPVDSRNLTVTSHSMSLNTPEIKLYPNPAVNEVKIYLTSEMNENFQIEIFNLKGQLAFRKNFDRPFAEEVSINLAAISLNEGVYILKYSNNNGVVQTRKFMKKNI